ncbi:FAD-binding oxidoreductase [Streptomyces sp. SP18CS02]|uniref:FAD-binding oxidoreductase n=1 Tax=Streptomyces sp. SP18CS02 TaxID=3002531 RepID=UPI002E7979A4|nr:FAD-binding oxidoreductase [Streptomyces sp. SP18CS02]MEE1754613.1 FAD-binding oxidoreductase [Streptomyces sp. SP18CS02]
MRERGAATAIEGEIFHRGEADYETVRAGMVRNGRKPGRFPEMIVRAASERDVPAAVRLARARGMRVAVRAGGHSWCGSSVRSDGMLIDLSRLRRCRVDPERGTATVQPAVTGAALAAELAGHGLAFPTGHCGSVALGGYLLSGGLGWNSGAVGPACHSVYEVEAVTADGEVVRCDEDENPDLFWAARGAGPGFFAVATAFRLRPYRLPRAITSTTYAFPLTDVDEVAEWATGTAKALPPTVELSLVLATADPRMTEAAPRQKVVVVAATAFADTREQAARSLRPLQDGPLAARALLHEVNVPTSPRELFEFSGGRWPPQRRYAVDTLWSDADLGTLLSRLAGAVARAPSGQSLVLAPLSPVSRDEDLLRDMAFSVLGSSYVVPYAIWDDPAEDGAHTRWLREAMGTVEPLGTGHYIAEADLTAASSRAERSFTADDWRRLRALRERYDPQGVFHAYPAP